MYSEVLTVNIKKVQGFLYEERPYEWIVFTLSILAIAAISEKIAMTIIFIFYIGTGILTSLIPEPDSDW